MHIAWHNSVHLVATISQSVNLVPLYFETHESLRTKPVCGWFIIEEGGGTAHGGYACHYSWERAILCKMVCHTTHKAAVLLPLVVIHSLGHPDT